MTANKLNTILFYDVKDPYGWGSNFYKPKNLVINGEKWLTTEAYFQAMKFRGPGSSVRSIEYSNLIREADSPGKVFMLGNSKPRYGYASHWRLSKKDGREINDLIKEYSDVNRNIRSDWGRESLGVMVKVLIVKFVDNEDLRKLITSVPDNTYFVEHTPRDKKWADGGDGGSGLIGTNYLGKILTALSFVLKHGTCRNMSKELKKKISITL
jgi:predicted NAD-dependent protein-ADP-ribosyltransferase YbiA (DUF1768 family)